MKVKELIERLSKFDENSTVFCGNQEGCGCDTDILNVVKEQDNEVLILMEYAEAQE